MVAQSQPDKGVEKAVKARGRVSKEDAAYSITFLDDKNAESVRIPTVVTGVKVSAANGKHKVVHLKEIPPAVLGQMAAFAVRNKLNMFLGDITKANSGAAIDRTNEFLKVAKDATLFVPKEGGGPGRAVDTDLWVAVIAKVADIKIKNGVPNVQPMSDKAKEAFRTKLLAMTPEQRKEKIKQWSQDKTFKNAVLIVRAERAQAEASDTKDSGEYNVLADI